MGIAIARFDTDGDNNVSEMEFMKSAYAGGVCVTNAVSGVQGFNLMASLIFVATHLANIGRPKPWYASPETVVLRRGREQYCHVGGLLPQLLRRDPRAEHHDRLGLHAAAAGQRPPLGHE